MADFTIKSLAKLAKGDQFTVLSFTGMQFGTYAVTKCNKTTFTTQNRKGEELTFNRKTGKQVISDEDKDPKYASQACDLYPKADRKPLVEPETPEQRRARRKARRDARKAAAEAEEKPVKRTRKPKKEEPIPADDEDEDIEYEEEEEEKPAPKRRAKKAPAKRAPKKPAPKKEEEDDDDWDADEEEEDEEWEED